MLLTGAYIRRVTAGGAAHPERGPAEEADREEEAADPPDRDDQEVVAGDRVGAAGP